MLLVLREPRVMWEWMLHACMGACGHCGMCMNIHALEWSRGCGRELQMAVLPLAAVAPAADSCDPIAIHCFLTLVDVMCKCPCMYSDYSPSPSPWELQHAQRTDSNLLQTHNMTVGRELPVTVLKTCKASLYDIMDGSDSDRPPNLSTLSVDPCTSCHALDALIQLSRTYISPQTSFGVSTESSSHRL